MHSEEVRTTPFHNFRFNNEKENLMRDTINFVRIVPKAPSITFYTISTYDHMCTIRDGDSGMTEVG